ncbi:MAG TPA: hypothetical protein VLQ89_00725, partial [Candidatus Binatia bacterium]|nr:hypothetical protein [Candidatus Binatia bacterium]
GPAAPELDVQVAEVVSGLSLDRVFFDPPPRLRVGCPLQFELGVHQNLKGEVMRRLLERRVCRFDRSQIELTIEAGLQVAGCRVQLTDAPRGEIDSPGFMDWKWEILPETSGPGSVRLSLEIQVHFIGFGTRKKNLMILDRPIAIKEKHWFDWRRWVRSKAN